MFYSFFLHISSLWSIDVSICYRSTCYIIINIVNENLRLIFFGAILVETVSNCSNCSIHLLDKMDKSRWYQSTICDCSHTCTLMERHLCILVLSIRTVSSFHSYIGFMPAAFYALWMAILPSFKRCRVICRTNEIETESRLPLIFFCIMCIRWAHTHTHTHTHKRIKPQVWDVEQSGNGLLTSGQKSVCERVGIVLEANAVIYASHI